MNKPLVTIFTPAYNVENYITVCIESVLNQTYNCFEWILVDNGSTDDTKSIIQEYAKKDKRIKRVRFPKNTDGFAQDMITRFGNGRYVAKLDSDDFWEDQYLEKLVNAMEENEADLACCKAIVLDEIRNERHCHGFRKYEGLVTAENLAELYAEIETDMNTYWAKLMKRDLFIKAHNACKEFYRVKGRVRYAGDTVFMYHYLSECRKSVFLTDKMYFYRLHRKNASKRLADIGVAEDCASSFEVKRSVLEKYGAWNPKNASLVYQAFWRNIDEFLRNIVKNSEIENCRKAELIGEALSGSRTVRIRKEYCDEYIRNILSAHTAWCYMNAGQECGDVFRKMLVTLDPDLFSEMTKEQCCFLTSEKALLSLFILGEREEALNHLEKLHEEGGGRECGIYSYFYKRLIEKREGMRYEL